MDEMRSCFNSSLGEREENTLLILAINEFHEDSLDDINMQSMINLLKLQKAT